MMVVSMSDKKNSKDDQAPHSQAQQTQRPRKVMGRPRMYSALKNFTMSWPPELLMRLDALADQRGITRSELIRQLVVQGVEKAEHDREHGEE